LPDIIFRVKVMVSIPDDLLARIDAGAAERGESRSAFLQEAARMRLGEPDPKVLAAIESIQGLLVGTRGLTAAEAIRQDRDRDLIGR
jgi:metal-responsive CopG/Arc/MetJ family transcriptional regulator